VTEWIVVPSQVFRADCDIILDAISDPEAQASRWCRFLGSCGWWTERSTGWSNWATPSRHS